MLDAGKVMTPSLRRQLSLHQCLDTPYSIHFSFSREQQSLKVAFFDGHEKPLRPYEIHAVAWEQIEKNSSEIFAILRRANQTARLAPEIVDGLRKSGQILFDLLIPSQAKDKLAATTAAVLTLHLEDTLVHLPWELLHDGREFLCRRFATGRIASTRQAPTARSVRAFQAPFRVLIIADPRRDLEACYREGLEIKTFLDRKRNIFQVDFKSHPVDIAFVKANIRDYDIVHYAGHAKYDGANPSESGWLLSDGTLKASEIAALGGFQPMPALLFCNACQSGHSDPWKNHDEIFGLANAFLLAGVQHYVGTFWEIAEEPGLGFAKYFYQSIAKGEAVGPALRSARRALSASSRADNVAWANYMLYGDPSSKFGDAMRQATTHEEHIGWRRILRGKTLRKPRKTERRSPTSPVLIGILLVASIFTGYSFVPRFLSNGTPSLPQVTAKPGAGATSISAIAVPFTMTMNVIAQRKEPDGSYSEVLVREGSVLHSGDHFQVQVETNRPSHVYVLIFDSRGEASELFPDPKIETADVIEAGHKTPVPDKGLWFWLDSEPGTETIYTLASERAIPDIHDLLSKMEKVGHADHARLGSETEAKIQITERGIGGIATGKTIGFRPEDRTQLQRIKKVTEVVASTGAVVRAISFEHR